MLSGYRFFLCSQDIPRKNPLCFFFGTPKTNKKNPPEKMSAIINNNSTVTTCTHPIPSPSCIIDNQVGTIYVNEISPKDGTSITIGGNLDFQGLYGPINMPFILFSPIDPSSIVTPVQGMVIYSTSTNSLSYYDGSSWVNVTGGGGGGGVPSITGTADQVYVNGTSGAPVTAASTLSLPQSLNTTNSPEFAGLGLGGPNSDASALLQCTSTTKGAVLPVMSLAEREAIASPAQGLIVFDTNYEQQMIYTGTAWTSLGGKMPFIYSFLANPQAIPNETVTPIVYDTVYQNHLITLDTTTGVFTVLQSGNYVIQIGFDVYPSFQPAGSYVNMGYYLNGVFYDVTTYITVINNQETRFSHSFTLPISYLGTFQPAVWANGGPGTVTIRPIFSGGPPYQGAGSWANMVMLNTYVP